MPNATHPSTCMTPSASLVFRESCCVARCVSAGVSDRQTPKSRVFDYCVICFIKALRSQTMGTRECQPKNSPSQCLSPCMILWSRSHARVLFGQERLALQGMNQEDLPPVNKQVSSSRQCSLAGDMYNLMSYTQVWHAILAAVPLPRLD